MSEAKEQVKIRKSDIKKILKLKKKAKHIAENRDEFSADIFFTPIIYFLKKEGKVIYIGYSMDGISRVVSHTKKEFKDFDSFSVEYFKGHTKKQMLAIEASLIRKFKPTLNITHNK